MGPSANALLSAVDDIRQFHIPSDESLEQGRNRSRELLFLHGTAPISHSGLVGGTTAAALLLCMHAYGMPHWQSLAELPRKPQIILTPVVCQPSCSIQSRTAAVID